MSVDTSWAAEMSAIKHNVCFKIEDTSPVKMVPDDSELLGSGFPTIIGNSAGLRRVLRMVRVVAPTEATVLVQGETGTARR
jgi:transcriptional regulator with GAF, ATPase, and Fis domain